MMFTMSSPHQTADITLKYGYYSLPEIFYKRKICIGFKIPITVATQQQLVTADTIQAVTVMDILKLNKMQHKIYAYLYFFHRFWK